MALDDHAAADSPTLEEAVTMAVDLAMEVVGVSTAVASPLVVVSSTQSTSSPIGHASSSLCLEADVVLQFDATHRLSELTASWGRLTAGAASFEEQLQVGVFFFLVFSISACFTLFSYSLPFCAGEVFLSGSL
jgi:hypothetical protein